MPPAELPAAVGGLILVPKLPPDYFSSACGGKIQFSWAICQLLALLTKETVSNAHLIVAGAAAGSSALPSILPLVGSYSFAFRHVMQNSEVRY